MKKLLLIMIAGAALTACSEPATTTDTTTSTTTVETPEGTTDTTTETTTTETTTTSVPATDTTMANDDNADAEEEADMAAGDGIEGKVETWDGPGQSFTMMEGDKPYTVLVNETTTYVQKDQPWDATGFFGEDRAGKDVAVEGMVNDSDHTITATKVTLYE